MILPDSTSFFSLIDYCAPFTWIIACGVFASVPILRYKKKDDHRDYKVPLIIPILAFCVSFASIFLPIITQPNWAYLYAALVMVTGYLIYFPFFHFELNFPGSDWIYKNFQLLLECVPNDYEDFKE